MLNKEIFVLNPDENTLINDGIAKLNTAQDEQGQKIILHEIKTFVCEGEYEKGLSRLLKTYLDNFDRPVQPAAWVSGFFGSGKSHLVKMLSYFWEDFEFAGGETARKIKRLPDDINDQLVELSRLQGVHGKLVVRGTMKDYPAKDVHYAFIQLLLRALGLPDQLHYFMFYDWCNKEGILDRMKEKLKEKGKTFEEEIKNMYVSSALTEALMEILPGFADSQAHARENLKMNFPRVSAISRPDFLHIIKNQVFPYVSGQIPCILVVLDEIQQYIGNDQDKSAGTQFLAEDLCENFNGKLLLVGTGQNALRDTPLLQRLKDRFTVSINLTDQDADLVNRKTVLEKKNIFVKEVNQLLDTKSGELSRLLHGTEYGYVAADKEILVADYPILPSVRKFWKRILKSIDIAGTSGQLRSQLRIVFEGLKSVAQQPLGNFIPADFIFTQKKGEMLQSGLLLNDISNIIEELAAKDDNGLLKSRILSIVFLINLLQKDDRRYWLKSDKNTIADLLINNLNGSTDDFRNQVKALVDELVDTDKCLVQIENEYKLQTKVGSEWELEYSSQSAKIRNDDQLMFSNRRDKMIEYLKEQLRQVFIIQGKSRIKRDFVLYTDADKPKVIDKLNIWLKDGWIENENLLMDEIRQEGNEQPLAYLFIRKEKDQELKREIVKMLAAKATLEEKGLPGTPEGRQARDGMETRMQLAKHKINETIGDICREAKVYLAGGSLIDEGTLVENIKSALDKAAIRQFKDFSKADYNGWERAVNAAFKGNSQALEEIQYQGDVKDHPMAADILGFIGNGSKQGKDFRNNFMKAPCGWPQDAIDAMLMVLKLTDHISTTETSLNQRSIAQASFVKEVFTLTTKQKMAVRAVYQTLNISCKSGEESGKSTEFLAAIRKLTGRICGDAPKPESLDDSMITEAEHLDGNERLLRIAENKDVLKQNIEDWQKQAATITARMPEWELLTGLKSVAPDTAEIKEIGLEIQTIRNDRMLLHEPDPVQGPLNRLAEFL